MVQIRNSVFYCALIFGFLNYFDHLDLRYFSGFRVLKESQFLRISLLVAFIVAGVLILANRLISTEKHQPITAQISVEEFENQKKAYTQKSLLELFNTQQYQTFIRKRNFKDLNPEEFKHSDEEM